MLISLLTYLLISNALSLRKDKSILFSRIVMTSLILASFLAFNNLFVLSLDKDIGIYGGLFHVAAFTQSSTFSLNFTENYPDSDGDSDSEQSRESSDHNVDDYRSRSIAEDLEENPFLTVGEVLGRHPDETRNEVAKYYQDQVDESLAEIRDLVKVRVNERSLLQKEAFLDYDTETKRLIIEKVERCTKDFDDEFTDKQFELESSIVVPSPTNTEEENDEDFEITWREVFTEQVNQAFQRVKSNYNIAANEILSDLPKDLPEANVSLNPVEAGPSNKRIREDSEEFSEKRVKVDSSPEASKPEDNRSPLDYVLDKQQEDPADFSEDID